MLIQEAALAHLVGHILVEGGGVQVGGLLGHDQLADDLRRRDDPGQAQARREQLGEGAQVDDVAAVALAVSSPRYSLSRCTTEGMCSPS